VDVIFILTSVAPTTDVTDATGKVVIPAGAVLDRNGDGNGDTQIYPSSCGSLTSVSCGFSPQESNFNIGGVTLNFRYTLTVRFRNAQGAALYEGTSAAFDNIESNSSAISLTINKV